MIAEPSSPPQLGTQEQVIEYEEKETNFSFKQLRKISLGDDITQFNFHNGDKLSLLCSSRLYGLVFIAKTNGFITFPAHNLVRCHEANYTLPLSQTVTADKSGIQAQLYELATPFFLSLNSDNSVLVCLSRNTQNIITAAFYDITIFSPHSPQRNPNSIFPLTNDPNLVLIDLQWNPTKTDSFAVSFSSGQTHLMQFKLPQSMRQLSILCKITTSLCWSPKGKHIAMGTNNGTIEQWSCDDDNIKIVKLHPKVQNFGSLKTKIVHLKWISTVLFAVVYSVQTESGYFEQILVLKHSKKGEPSLYVNFNDIYRQSENAETFYFTELFLQQKILVTTTGLANEVVVLANHGNATSPMEWFSAILDETSRAELPLHGADETYPMGFAVDTTSQSVIPSDKSPLPPHPILLLLTTKGVLCPFHMIYEGMTELVEPPRVLKSAKQPTNPQEVTKNLSTTTVTVIGSNTATTAKNTTYTITPNPPVQTQAQLNAQSTTTTLPAPIQTVSPGTVTTLIPASTVVTQQLVSPGQQPQQQPTTLGQQQQQPVFLHKTPPRTLFVPQTSPNKPTSVAQPALFYLGKSPNTDTATKETKQTPVPTQQQPPSTGQQQQQQQPPSSGQQQQPPSTGQQQQASSIGQQPQLNLLAQQQKQSPAIGQQPSSTGQQQQQTSTGQQQQASSTGQQQKKLSPSIGQQQQHQASSTGQQQQPSSTGLQKQPQISPQANLSLINSQAFANIPQQTANPTPKPSPAYIPPKQPTPHVTPSSIIPPGVQPQYMTSQTLPTVSLTMPAPSPLEIEVRYETHIRNEIDDFSEDLETLKTKIREKFGDFDDPFPSANTMKHLVGSDEEMRRMYKESAKVRLELDHTVKICDEMNQILSTIRNEGFHIQEKIEDANTAKKWISTAKFSSFIAATPLDPVSEEKKRLLIQTYNAIDQRLQEIEITMEEMLFHSSDNEKQTMIQTMGLLEQNLEKLHIKLDKISEQVDTVKLNRQISRINLSNSCIHPFELLNKSLEKRHFNFKIQSDRIVELKDFLFQTTTPRLIKPRNPTDTLKIPRTVKTTIKSKSIQDLPQPQPFTTAPNQGFKLLLSPEGEFFVVPNLQSLPDGCVSFDTSQLHRLSQPMVHTLPKQQQQQQQHKHGFQPVAPNLPGQVDRCVNLHTSQQQQQQQPGLSPIISDYSRSSIPKTIVEHKPPPSQQQQPEKLPPMPNLLQMAGQKPDYSPSLPKTLIEPKPPTQQQHQQPTGINTSSPQKISSPQQQQPTSVQPISPQKISSPQQQPLPPNITPKDPPRVNRILDFSTPPKPTATDSSPHPLTPFKPLDSSPDKPAPNVNPFTDPSYSLFGPTKGLVSPDTQPVTSTTDPISPPHPPSSPKTRSDLQLFSLLSAGEAKQGKELAKTANPTKPPSTLLQSTSADSNTSPTKTADTQAQQLDESQTLNIKTEVPLKPTQARELNESQTINIPVNTSPKPGSIAPPKIAQPSVPQGFPGPAQPPQAVPVPHASPEGDSEMQDDNEYGDSLQGISLGNQAKSTATNFSNPFGGKTSAPIGGSNPFSGVGQNTFAPPNMAPQTQPQGSAAFGRQASLGGQANFGGTPNLFTGPSLLQGIGGNQPKLFGQTASAPTFGSIASQNQSPQGGFGQQASFGQPGFGQTTPMFGGNQGQSQGFPGFGNMPPGQQQGFNGQGQAGPGFGSSSGGGATPEMKGKAFTSYRN